MIKEITIENPDEFDSKKMGNYLQVKILPDVVIERKIKERFEDKDETIPILILGKNDSPIKYSCNYTISMGVLEVSFFYKEVEFVLYASKQASFHINAKGKITEINHGSYMLYRCFKYNDMINTARQMLNIYEPMQFDDRMEIFKKENTGLFFDFQISSAIKRIDNIFTKIDEKSIETVFDYQCKISKLEQIQKYVKEIKNASK